MWIDNLIYPLYLPCGMVTIEIASGIADLLNAILLQYLNTVITGLRIAGSAVVHQSDDIESRIMQSGPLFPGSVDLEF